MGSVTVPSALRGTEPPAAQAPGTEHAAVRQHAGFGYREGDSRSGPDAVGAGSDEGRPEQRAPIVGEVSVTVNDFRGPPEAQKIL